VLLPIRRNSNEILGVPPIGDVVSTAQVASLPPQKNTARCRAEGRQQSLTGFALTQYKPFIAFFKERFAILLLRRASLRNDQ